MKKTIGITGGIGSGKTLISQILTKMGYPVYNCDQSAQMIMHNKTAVIDQIKQLFGVEAYQNQQLNKPHIAGIIFQNKEKLKQINTIVHPVVIQDMKQWIQAQNSPLIFIESALFNEPTLNQPLNSIWEITAPENIRIKRVLKRDNTTIQEIQKRINNQQSIQSDPRLVQITNDEKQPLLPQIEQLLKNELKQ